MYKIPVRQVEEKVEGRNQPLKIDYGEVFVTVLRSGGASGLTIGQMEDRLSVVKKAREATPGSHIFVTAKERDVLLQALQSYQFPIFAEGLIRMKEEVEYAAEETESDG